MKLTKTVGVVLAVLLVATGVAAGMPGAVPSDAPPDQANDNSDRANDSHAENESHADDESRADENRGASAADDRGAGAADERADDAGNAGPPADMPDQVPDHVSEIHDLIRQHVSGAIDGNLGHLISDVTPDDSDVPMESPDDTDGDDSDA